MASAGRRMASFSRVISPSTRTLRPGPRERLTVHETFGQTEEEAELAHLVLEEIAQRLHDAGKAEILRKPANVVVALDDRRARAGLDDVG